MKLRPKEILVTLAASATVLVAFLFALNGAAAGADSEIPARSNAKNVRSADAEATDVAKAPAAASVPESAAPSEPTKTSRAPAPSVQTEPVPAAPSKPVPAAPSEPVPAAAAPQLASKPAKAPRPAMKSFYCAGQICIDADTGAVLSEHNSLVRHPPASVTKLMTIFLVLDAVDAGTIRLSTPVVASRNAQETGGTQVYLAEGEVNTVEDLLYALMLQSANDAAVALAEHVGGSVENFVAEMNRKAAELGLSRTKFSTPHGLPISKKDSAAGKKPDLTCAADLATLSRALIKAHPNVFRYTAAKTKVFRDGKFGVQPLPMSNHNKLLTYFPGCDGLKTGWTNAGASIVTTASRGNRRVIAVVLGGIVPAAGGGVDAKTSQRERNQRAAELMFDGFKKIDVLKYEPTPEKP